MPNGKPNIIVVFGDDVGVTHLSCYSDGIMGYETPEPHRWAGRFSNRPARSTQRANQGRLPGRAEGRHAEADKAAAKHGFELK